jgi:hypothetical protein
MLVVPSINDVQVDPRVDGYVYCFTSVAEGPVFPRELWMQLLVLLHVLNSFIPQECILQTEYLKPFLHSHCGLEKLIQEVELPEHMARQARELRDKLAKMPISQMPMNAPFVVGSNSDDSEDTGASFKPEFERRLCNPGDLLIVPVTIKHFTPYNDDYNVQRASALDMHGQGEDFDGDQGFWLLAAHAQDAQVLQLRRAPPLASQQRRQGGDILSHEFCVSVLSCTLSCLGCMHTHMHTHTSTHTHICTQMHTHTHAHTHICTHSHIHTYTQTHTNQQIHTRASLNTN